MLPQRTEQQEQQYVLQKGQMYVSIWDAVTDIICAVAEESASNTEKKRQVALRFCKQKDQHDGSPYLHCIDDHDASDFIDPDHGQIIQMAICATQTIDGREFVASANIQYRDDATRAADVWFDFCESSVLVSWHGSSVQEFSFLGPRDYDLQTATVDLYNIDPRKESIIAQYAVECQSVIPYHEYTCA